MSSKKIRRKTQGPPPRAGFGCDAILERGGQVVNIRKLYVGPSGLDPDDLTELLSAVVAATMINALPEADTLMVAKYRLLEMLEARIQPVKPPVVDEEAADILPPEAREAQEAKEEDESAE